MSVPPNPRFVTGNKHYIRICLFEYVVKKGHNSLAGPKTNDLMHIFIPGLRVASFI